MTTDPGRILVFIPMYNCEKQIVRVLATLEGRVADVIDSVRFARTNELVVAVRGG